MDGKENEPKLLELKLSNIKLGNNEGIMFQNNVKEHSSKLSLSLQEIYSIAVKFFKEYNGKAVHLTYDDKIKLVSFILQATHGKFDLNKSSPIGVLDVIGRDRRQAWQNLNDMSREEAMKLFVEELNSTCTLFKPYLEAHQRDLEEKAKKFEEQQLQAEKKFLEKIEIHAQLDQDQKEKQKRQIQDILNKQTFHQFKEYAEKQFPGNPEQQGVLIRQLQEQHYQKYMQQIYEQHIQQQKPDLFASKFDEAGNNTSSSDEELNDHEEQTMAQASMWTKKNIIEFKDKIRKDGGDGVIRVGHGETMTVRVPTHPEGSALYWEFATDKYDIGFGVYFEWSLSPGDQVTVHISESEDEEDVDEIQKHGCDNDPEKGEAANHHLPLSVVIPVYRRDCHDEVYAGSHPYPGSGVYLLKFDNSYSLWRSKTLYYRVFYTK